MYLRGLLWMHLRFWVATYMSMVNPPISPILIQHLMAEINRLTQEQFDALRNARFSGMTEADVREFQKRRKGIGELARGTRSDYLT
jgi:hypothetical protein